MVAAPAPCQQGAESETTDDLDSLSDLSSVTHEWERALTEASRTSFQHLF